mgnify:CR=1 FL=1
MRAGTCKNLISQPNSKINGKFIIHQQFAEGQRKILICNAESPHEIPDLKEYNLKKLSFVRLVNYVDNG